uniref:Uncharacterized protein n=1 Tax=Cacopsylla melanoneura TaxID=428564 RepID=A0A8D9EEW9_9HEMI
MIREDATISKRRMFRRQTRIMSESERDKKGDHPTLNSSSSIKKETLNKFKSSIYNNKKTLIRKIKETTSNSRPRHSIILQLTTIITLIVKLKVVDNVNHVFVLIFV